MVHSKNRLIGRRSGILVAALLVVAGVFVNTPEAAAVVPPKGNRVLAMQASEAQGQSEANALDEAKTQGITSQSMTIDWVELEPSPQTYDFTKITEATTFFANEGVTIELKINPIYTCSRRVPSDLANLAWDNATMMSRFRDLLDGIYDASHPGGGTPDLSLTLLNIGTEVDSALRFGWNETSHIDYYTKYKTFFEDARSYARSLWGSSLPVGVSSVWSGMTSTTPHSSSNATNAVLAGSSTLTFTSAPAAFSNGDYVSVDYGQAGQETRRIVSGAGTTTWTLNATLASAHPAGYWVARTLGNAVQTLNTNTDVVLFSYYGINIDLTVKDPYTAPYNDIWAAVQLYPGRVMGIIEAGYPSSSELNSSNALQDAFITSMFGAWDQYCESSVSCNSPALKYMNFQWGTDWDEDDVIPFAIAGCNGNAPPNVSTTNTNAASAGQNQITFTSAPSGFSNGDVVILDKPFSEHEETLVISSGSGTTTWTMTTNLGHAHSAGYRVLLKVLHGPTVTPVNGASTTWGYYVSAYNANGDSLASFPTSTTTGPATLDATHANYISWDAVPGATGYRVFRHLAGGSPATTGKIADVVGSTNVWDTGLSASAYVNATIRLKDFIGSLGYRTWASGGTDKPAWDQLCTEANARGWSTRSPC